MKIKDCMSTEVHWVMPETKVAEVAKLMKNNHIGCVPVCDSNNTVCGIVTDRDILLRAVACDKDVNQTLTSDIMTTNVYTCKQDEEVSNAETKMSTYQIRRLPVCDDNHKMVGILTLGNLAQNDNQIGEDRVGKTLNNICDCERNSNGE